MSKVVVDSSAVVARYLALRYKKLGVDKIKVKDLAEELADVLSAYDKAQTSKTQYPMPIEIYLDCLPSYCNESLLMTATDAGEVYLRKSSVLNEIPKVADFILEHTKNYLPEAVIYDFDEAFNQVI